MRILSTLAKATACNYILQAWCYCNAVQECFHDLEPDASTGALNLLLQLDATVEHTLLRTASDIANVSVSTSDITNGSKKGSTNTSYNQRSNGIRISSSSSSSGSGSGSGDSAVDINRLGQGTDNSVSSVAASWSNPFGHNIHTEHGLMQVQFPRAHNSPSAAEAHKFYLGVTLLACLSAYSIVFAYWPSTPSHNKETVPAAGIGGNKNAPTIGSKERVQHWDIIRCVLELMVIFTHTAEKLFPQSEVALATHQFFMPFMMPAFTFLSGVFGSSVTYDSISNMLCYTVGMTILFECCFMLIKWGCGDDWPPAPSMDVWELWYIGALVIWRLFISTFFHAGRLLHIPRSVLWLVTLLISYFAHISAVPYVTVYDPKGVGFVYAPPNNGGFVYAPVLEGKRPTWAILISSITRWPTAMGLLDMAWFAPFFAVGLCLSPSEWTNLLRQSRLQCFALIYVSVCLCLRYYINGPTQVLQSMWDFGEGKHPLGHAPLETCIGPPNLLSFCRYVMFITAKGTLAIGVVWVMAAVVSAAQGVYPTGVSLMAGWGSRTLYAYILHPELLSFLSGLKWSAHVSPVCAFWLCCFVTVLLNTVLSSKGTQNLLRWMMQPYWIKGNLESAVMLLRGVVPEKTMH